MIEHLRKSVLMVIAHPDDAAYGMGGFALLLKEKFRLHLVCATKGERGLKDHDLHETAAIREQEQRAECRLLGAELTFLGRIDREMYADNATCRQVAAILEQTIPAAVFTIWPVDFHPDHSAIAEIVMKAIFMTRISTDLVYAEEGEAQTALFNPEIYVDISPVIGKKLELVRCHTCQNRDDSMARACLKKAEQRGAEAGYAYAEGYRILPCNGSGGRSVFTSLDPDRIRTIVRKPDQDFN